MLKRRPFSCRDAFCKITIFVPIVLIIGVILALIMAATTLANGVIVQASTGVDGTPGNDDSSAPAISSDGRFIAFASTATNLTTGDANGFSDIFIKDTQTGVVTLASTSSSGIQGNGASISPSISANGRYVAFSSLATNLTSDGTGGFWNIFVKDTQTGTTTLVSPGLLGGLLGPSNGNSMYPSISGDGTRVAFVSAASNLILLDLNGKIDVFVWSGSVSRISQTSSILFPDANDDSGGYVVGGAFYGTAPPISADGRYVTFYSAATNLVSGDSNAKWDVFRKDTSDGSVQLISTDSAGTQANADSKKYLSMSTNGRYIAFDSAATNLVSGGTSNTSEVFLKDAQTDATQLVSASATGAQGNGASQDPSIAADGHYVAFDTAASNLISGDTNGAEDVMVKDVLSAAITRVSIQADGAQATGGHSYQAAMSADASSVAFTSGATNLIAGDTNGKTEVFKAHTAMNIPAAQNYYATWYDDLYGLNWVMMANPTAALGDTWFDLYIAGAQRDLSPVSLTGSGCPAAGCGPGQVPPGRTITPRFNGVMGGPLDAVSLTADKPIVSQRSLWSGSSLEEVLGIEGSSLSDYYFWSWYDQRSAGYINWVLVANPNATPVYYEIRIGGFLMQGGTMAAGERVTPTYNGVMGGPVEVQAWTDAGKSAPALVTATQRVLTNYGHAFNEVPGIPVSQLSNHYLWTWYDQQSAGALNWVLVANPNAGDVTYEIKIGGNVYPGGTGTLHAGERAIPAFPGVRGGPVEVTSTGGNVIASQRSIWGPSFEEVPGTPYADLTSEYHWTWYDQLSLGSINWVMVANPNAVPVDYQIKIGGIVYTGGSGTLEPGEMKTPMFPGIMNGPVEVTSSGGNVMASQRMLWSGHFNEVLGTVLN